YRPPPTLASSLCASPERYFLPDDRSFRHVQRAQLLLASEPRAALQFAVRPAAARVLSDPGGAALDGPALHPQRRRRDLAGSLRGRGGPLGPAAVHDLPDRRRAVARRPRHACPRPPPPEPGALRDARRVARARARVRDRGRRHHVGRDRAVADAGAGLPRRLDLVDPPDGVARPPGLR